MTKILGITLARGGSKGVPNKHLRLMCGKPLLQWTLEAAQKSKYLDEYYVSSDSQEILWLAQQLSVGAIQRPEGLAQDDTPTLPALRHAVNRAETLHGRFDLIIEIRATSPLKTTEDIDRCIELLRKWSVDSVIGVTALEDHHPARAKWLDDEGLIHDFIPEPQTGRRQDLTPKAYVRNGTIYALKRDALMGANGKLFGHENSIGFEMPAERSVNIDTPLDWDLAELLMQRRGAK
jgi:CMP-N,N'-diacetyllegionaminic acid synthase